MFGFPFALKNIQDTLILKRNFYKKKGVLSSKSPIKRKLSTDMKKGCGGRIRTYDL